MLGVISARCASEQRAESDPEVGFAYGHEIFELRADISNQIERHNEVQLKVEECMKLLGFEYPLQEFQGGYSQDAITAFGTDRELSDAEYAKQFGLGILTFSEVSFEDDISEEEAAHLEAEANPLLFHIDAMDPQLAVEFEDALFGTGDGDDFGCLGEAGDEVWSSSAQFDNIDIESETERAKHAFSLDPQVREHYLKWSECMALEGYQYESLIGAYVEIRAQAIDSLLDESLYMEAIALERNVATASVACGAPTHDILPVELELVWAEYQPGS